MWAAWVTGGASGIGAAVVARLAARGTAVYVADVGPVPDGSPASGSDLVDVRDRAALERSCARAAAEDGLGLAVLCAGVGSTEGSTCDSVDLQSYQRIVDVNLTGVVHGIGVATPHLRRTRGSVVVLASLAGLTPYPDNPFYAMTKAGVVGLVRSLGPALARDGIRIAAVCPGFVDTPMVAPMREAFVSAGFPLLEAETVADAVLRAAAEGESGTCWVVQPGREPLPYAFRGVPGAIQAGGTVPPPASVR
jgi:NAD(P)-dependent dehydrogenase (short-subunit alcohol dehydrogenase family)